MNIILKGIRLIIKQSFFYIKSRKTKGSFAHLKNIKYGKRCFILGNGPSIKNYDLTKLNNEDVFITNRGYYLKKLGLKNINYYMLGDSTLYFHDSKNIDKETKDVPYKFFSIMAKPELNIKINEYFYFYRGFLGTYINKKFDLCDPEKGLFQGGTIVLDAAQIANFLGYKEIIFLGIDMNYIKGNEHFYKKTKKEEHVHKLNFNLTSKCFSIMESFFKKHGIKMINATRESKLKAINFIDYNKLFNDKL